MVLVSRELKLLADGVAVVGLEEALDSGLADVGGAEDVVFAVDGWVRQQISRVSVHSLTSIEEKKLLL